MKRIASVMVILTAIFTLNSYAIARPSVDLSVDFLSQYIWRGYALSHDSAVIQPSINISYKGLSLNIWGNYDTDEDKPGGNSKWNETDYTFCYEYDISRHISINMGTIYYELDEAKDSFEIFGGVSADLKYLDFGLTIYREVSHYPGWWLQFDLSKNIEFPCYGMNLDIGIGFIYQASDDEDAYPDPDNPNDAFEDWQSGNISAVLNIPINKYITISPKISYSFPLTGKASDEIEMISWERDDNFLYGGINITCSF